MTNDAAVLENKNLGNALSGSTPESSRYRDLRIQLRSTGGRRQIKERVSQVAMVGSFCVIMIPLLLVMGAVLAKGIGSLSLDFFTKDIPTLRTVGPGMGPAILGTILITLGATAMAVPFGVATAVYLNEYGQESKTAQIVRFLSSVMAGVPSIVMGLFVYTVWTLRFGQSGLGGAFALACLMLPIVIRSAEEMLRLVPNYLREASYALGSSKSYTIIRVVLPSAFGGIVSGSLLAIARAAGETAPLLFTIGIVQQKNMNLFSGANTTLSAQIFANAQSPFVGAQERAWGAALTLVLLTFAMTIGSRFVTKRFTRG